MEMETLGIALTQLTVSPAAAPVTFAIKGNVVERERKRERRFASGRLVGKFHKGTKINTDRRERKKERELLDGLLRPGRCLFATFCRINIPQVRTSPTVTAQCACISLTQPQSQITTAPKGRTGAQERGGRGSIFAARGHSISFFLPSRKRQTCHPRARARRRKRDAGSPILLISVTSIHQVNRNYCKCYIIAPWAGAL